MPEFDINKGSKFGCLALADTWISEDMSKPLQVNDSLWFLFSPPFPMEETWQKWLGTFRGEAFSKCNFLIFALTKAHNIEMLNGDNKTLEATVVRIYHSLLLHGVARHSAEGFILTGGNNGREIQATSVSPLFPHHSALHEVPKRVTKEIITSAIEVASVSKAIYDEKKGYLRFKQGLRINLSTFGENIALERLHQSVRAIEALLKPQIGATKKQFVHRCQTFGGRSNGTRDIYSEIFDLRSREEHLNDVDDILVKYGKDKCDHMICLRALQAELLAEHAYLRILQKRDIREFFRDDDSIDAFWKMDDDKRYTLWGEPIDIVNAVADKSHYFMRP